MVLLSSKPVVAEIKDRLKERAELFFRSHGRRPWLSVVLVGGDPASVIYTQKKADAALEVGFEHETIRFPDTATPEMVRETLRRLNQDPRVDGILIQRPLPASFREEDVLYWVDPAKDVDAFHPENAGRMMLGLPAFRPCTPAGVMELMRHYKIDPAGKLACVVGRSSIVGKPMAALLLQADATVLQCHSRSQDLAELTSKAEILIVAAGKPGLIGSRHVRSGAVVIDVGIHRTDEGRIVGDVLFDEVAPRVSAITPVPGGVGPMTIVTLLENTLFSAERRGR